MKIKQIQIKYFRSVYNQTIELGNLNVIAGMNDAGKSNLLKALNLFFNNETGWKEKFSFAKDFNLQRSKEFEGNKKLKDAKEIVIKITFEEINGSIPVWEKKWRPDGEVPTTPYDFNLRRSERTTTGFKQRSRIPSMLRKVKYLYVPALKGPEYISFLVGQLSNILSEKASKDIRGAATGFEGQLANYLSDITEDIKTALQIDSLLKLPYDLVNIFENMEFSDENGIALTHRGDGIRTRHIPILLNKISSLHNTFRDKGELYDHFIWGYEEPENNVELTACFSMAENFLRNYSTSHQIIISTHSPAFYGLPERFFPKWEQGNEKIFRYAAQQENGKTAYVNTSQEELDPLFLLPAITPHIEAERKKISDLQNEIEKITSKGIFFRKPSIILEGPSDLIIFKKGMSLFFPNKSESVDFLSPQGSQNGGGTSFVKDHLIIWESIQRHTPPADRLKAVGFFDDDAPGEKDLSEYKTTITNPIAAYGQQYKRQLQSEDHFLKLLKSDLNADLPFILENLYSPNLWMKAKSKGWLEKKENTIEYCSPKVISELASTNKKFSDLCTDEKLCVYVTHKVKNDAKLKVANFIKNSKDDDAKEYLYFFERILAQTLKKLGVIT